LLVAAVLVVEREAVAAGAGGLADTVLLVNGFVTEPVLLVLDVLAEREGPTVEGAVPCCWAGSLMGGWNG